MKRKIILPTVLILLVWISFVSAANTITIKGKLVDQINGDPISGASLLSAYEFSPEEVITDSEGNFIFTITDDFLRKEGAEAGLPDVGGSYSFFKPCYDYAYISFQKNYEKWESGQLKERYGLALIKSIFDGEEEVSDISGKSTVDVGSMKMYPTAHISIESDIEVSFNVMYKYKNLEGYNGGGNGNYRYEHGLTNALPLDYDVFIRFKEETGETHDSSTYHVPMDARCTTINLNYENGESDWSLGKTGDYVQTPLKYLELNLKKGWNLVPMVNIESGILDDSELKKTDLVVQYLYITAVNKYFKLFPVDSQKSQEEFQKAGITPDWLNTNMKYLLNSGTWLYSKKSGKLKVTQSGDLGVVNHKKVGLNKGWNFKTISKSMARKTFGEIKGSCNILKVTVWNFYEQKWEPTRSFDETETVTIDEGAVNRLVMLFKVEEDCMFGDEGREYEDIAPPPLP